jgi:hypothetical protein
MHYCIRCGAACDCWAYDQSHGDVCDACSDCSEADNVTEQESEDTGRYEGGYRTFRDGTCREDFGGDR